MLDWNSLTEDELLEYIGANLTLDQLAEKVYKTTNIISLDFVKDLDETDDEEFSLNWSELSDENIYTFLKLNTTLLDIAKDIFYNRLGNRMLTQTVINLLDDRVTAVRNHFQVQYMIL